MSSDALKSIPFPIPTLDKPFGVELWPIFEQVYTKLMGYPPSAFYFLPGQTPLSTIQATATMLITYYFVVLGGRELMKNRDPVKLNALFMVHNLYLTVASAIMLVLFIEQLVPTVWRRGVFFAICDHRGGWTRELVVLYYVCLPAAIPKTFTNPSADELSYQIHRVGRHRLPRAEKETIEYDHCSSDAHWTLTHSTSFLAHLPPWRYCAPLLHPAYWPHRCLMGSHHPEPPRSCSDVLVLFPIRPRCSHLVEGMDYPITDRTVRD